MGSRDLGPKAIAIVGGIVAQRFSHLELEDLRLNQDGEEIGSYAVCESGLSYLYDSIAYLGRVPDLRKHR